MKTQAIGKGAGLFIFIVAGILATFAIIAYTRQSVVVIEEYGDAVSSAHTINFFHAQTQRSKKLLDAIEEIN